MIIGTIFRTRFVRVFKINNIITLKRFWFDIKNPKQWGAYTFISHFLWKIKDYDRIVHDYCCVLDHVTNSRMSKPNYDLTTIYSEIDDAQATSYYGIVRDDLTELIEKGAKMSEIKKYINGL